MYFLLCQLYQRTLHILNMRMSVFLIVQKHFLQVSYRIYIYLCFVFDGIQYLTVFASFPHMHQTGSQIWTTHWRDGKQIAEIGRIEFWSFDHQTTQVVNIPICELTFLPHFFDSPLNLTIQPGDRLNTHCAYNTLGISSKTFFGSSSNQEMCMHFLSYFPRFLTPRNNPYPSSLVNSFSELNVTIYY
jgi:hypothetical protein